MQVSVPTYSPDAASVLRRDLCRLARFGANLSDAHSCFIFLPSLPFSGSRTPHGERVLELFGHHSLASDVIQESRISAETGLIGWVAKHHRSIHVSPFEQESHTLGVYHSDHDLKSFIGIPISVAFMPEGESGGLSGVIACDSKKSFAFSKIQGKLLEDLSGEISSSVRLLLLALRTVSFEASWREFLSRGEELMQALGAQSVQVLRLKVANFGVAESKLGTGRAIDLFEQVYRLAQQAIPPHLPSFKLPNGDLVFVVDTMMTNFYENKIRAICNHVVVDGVRLSFSFARGSLQGRRNATLEKVVGECGGTVIELREVAN